jgi:nucleolar protein 6
MGQKRKAGKANIGEVLPMMNHGKNAPPETESSELPKKRRKAEDEDVSIAREKKKKKEKHAKSGERVEGIEEKKRKPTKSAVVIDTNTTNAPSTPKDEKKKKKKKKSSSTGNNENALDSFPGSQKAKFLDSNTLQDTQDMTESLAIDSKSKKKKKADKNPSSETVQDTSLLTESNLTNNQTKHLPNLGQTQDDSRPDQDMKGSKPSHRFIVFIGNIPFTATKDSISTHFSAVSPISIRAPTKPGTTQSKGFAFLEFDRYDHMKSCLQLYHHSKFDDGKSPARRINVELT